MLAAVADAMVPPRCAGCGTPGKWLCVACRLSSDPVRSSAGPVAVGAAGAYEGPLLEAIHRYKYRGERALAAELGDLVAAVAAADLARGERIDAVVPVPLHRERAKTRGYDQAQLLAARVADRIGLELHPALHRIRWARAQVDLDRTARARNVEGAFVASAGSLAGARVALIDDVTTTGATLRAAAAAARAAGARAIRAYVVAIDE